MSRVGSRIGRLEGRREASRLRTGGDGRAELMAEDLERMRQTPEGIGAEQRYMEILEVHGREGLRTEEGQAATRAFRDAIFAAADTPSSASGAEKPEGEREE